MKYCHQCGHPNDDHNQYCENDGIQLESVDTSYRFELSDGAFCTSCGHPRDPQDLYCSSCGHHALEPVIGVNKVEESLKSVAATGSQVLAHLKQATKTKRLPDYKTISSGWLERPQKADVSQGALFGGLFLIVMIAFASILVTLLPDELRDTLREGFGSDASTFSLTAMITILLTANVYWSFSAEKFFSFTNQFDEEVNQILANFPIIAEAKFGNYMFALGGIFVLLVFSYFLFRGGIGRNEITGRFLGLSGTIGAGILVLSFFALDVTFIDTAWVRTIVTTLLSLFVVIGLGLFLSLKADGILRAAQRGILALLVVTLVSTVFGTGYYMYQMNALLSNEDSYSVDEVKPLLLVQGALSNWQSVGHGGKQGVTLETPYASMALSTSAFGTTVPNEIEASIANVGSSIDGFDGMLEEIFYYEELPDEGYRPTRELETLSPSVIGLLRQMVDAEYANDEVELERLMNEGIFSWFNVLVIGSLLIYAAFAYRVVRSKETLFAYTVAPFVVYLVWQWFLNGHIVVTVKDVGIMQLTASGMNITSLFVAASLIIGGGLIGWFAPLGKRS